MIRKGEELVFVPLIGLSPSRKTFVPITGRAVIE